jgi:hypothetical protein
MNTQNHHLCAIPPEITAVLSTGDTSIHITFADGIEANIDLKNRLHGEMFEPLKKPEFFRQVRINPETETIEWPNGADFAPSMLYEEALFAQPDPSLWPDKRHHPF